MLELVQLLDGEVGLDIDPEAPNTYGVWTEAVRALRKVLEGTTIADVVAQEGEASGAQMYYI